MTNIFEQRNHRIGGDYIKTHQNHIDAASKILKHARIPQEQYGGAEWAEQGGILKSEFYYPSKKTKIVLHTQGNKHHVSVENVLKKSTYHSYDTEYHPEDKDKTEILYSTTPNKPHFSWDHISDEYFSHAPDMDKWKSFSSEFSKAKTAAEQNEQRRKKENVTNINETVLSKLSRNDHADSLLDAAQHHINLARNLGPNHPRTKEAKDWVNILENRFFDKFGGFNKYDNRYLDLYKQHEDAFKGENLDEAYKAVLINNKTRNVDADVSVGDVIDKHGNESHSTFMDDMKRLVGIANKHRKTHTLQVHHSGDRKTIIKPTGWLEESHDLPAFSDDVHQKDKALHSLLSQYGEVEVEPWSKSKDFAKAYYLKHPTNKDHTLVVTHTKLGDDEGQHVVGYRPSKKTDHLLSFDHYKHWDNIGKEKTIASNNKMTKDDAFDDNFHHLKRYLENDWKKVGPLSESYNLVEAKAKAYPQPIPQFTNFDDKELDKDRRFFNDEWGDKWHVKGGPRTHATHQIPSGFISKHRNSHHSNDEITLINKKDPKSIISIGHGYDTVYDHVGNQLSRKGGLDFDHTHHGITVHSGTGLSSLDDYIFKLSKDNNLSESYNLVENTKKVLSDDLVSGYSKFISKQNSYNNLGVNEGIKDFFKTHVPDGTETYDTDPHETEAAFGHTLSRFREAGGNKWDLHIRGSHGRRIAGEKVTSWGKHVVGAKPIPHKTTGTLIGSFVHKENPEHRIDFALGRDGKGGTKILNAHHNMSGSSISNASIGDMEQFMGKLTRTAKGFQGLTEGVFGPHKSEKVHEKGIAALLSNGFKLDPNSTKENARAGKYLHFGQTNHHYLIHPNGKHYVLYNASSEPDYHSVSVYDGPYDENHLFSGNFNTPERMIQGLKDLKEAYIFSAPSHIKNRLENRHKEGVEYLKSHFEKDNNPSENDGRYDSPVHSGKVGTVMNNGTLPWVPVGTGTEFLKHKTNPNIKLDYWVEHNPNPASIEHGHDTIHKAILFKSNGGRLGEISHSNLYHFKESLLRILK